MVSEKSLNVRLLLNRILGVAVSMQNRIFAHFTALLEQEIEQAKESGEYEDGVVDIRGQSVSIVPAYPKSLATDTLSMVDLQHYQLAVDYGLTFDAALQVLGSPKSSPDMAAGRGYGGPNSAPAVSLSFTTCR